MTVSPHAHAHVGVSAHGVLQNSNEVPLGGGGVQVLPCTGVGTGGTECSVHSHLPLESGHPPLAASPSDVAGVAARHLPGGNMDATQTQTQPSSVTNPVGGDAAVGGQGAAEHVFTPPHSYPRDNAQTLTNQLMYASTPPALAPTLPSNLLMYPNTTLDAKAAANEFVPNWASSEVLQILSGTSNLLQKNVQVDAAATSPFLQPTQVQEEVARLLSLSGCGRGYSASDWHPLDVSAVSHREPTDTLSLMPIAAAAALAAVACLKEDNL